MLGIGDKFPFFSLTANVGVDEEAAFLTLTDQDFDDSWKVYLFWPKDFSVISREEIVNFAALSAEFRNRDAQLIGVSVESEYAHLAWRSYHEDLSRSPFPMLADVRRDLCGQLGILDEHEGTCQRATFIVDPEGCIRFVYVTDQNVVHDPREVLRVLADLQSVAQHLDYEI